MELALLLPLLSELHQHLVHLLDELLVYVLRKRCVLREACSLRGHFLNLKLKALRYLLKSGILLFGDGEAIGQLFELEGLI